VEGAGVDADPKAGPWVGGPLRVHAVSALPSDDLKMASDPADGLVEHDVVFERVGAGDVIVVGVLRAPDHAGRTVLGSGDSLELDLDKAVPDVGVVLQQQGIGRLARLLHDLQL